MFTIFVYSVIIFLVIVCITLFALVVYIKYSFGYWKKRNVPYIEPKIPFGNLQHPRRRTCSIGEHIKNMYELAKSKGWKHIGIYFFASANYIPVDLNYLKHILATDFNHFIDRGMYYNEVDDPISAHLFAIGGEKWRSLRKKVTPNFTPAHMKKLVPLILECATYLCGAIDNSANPIDIKEFLGRFTTDVIGSCAFGLDCNSIKEEDSPFRVFGKLIFFSSKLRTFTMTLATNFPRAARFCGVRQITKEIAEFYRNVVLDTIKDREERNIRRNDFLQLLIDLKNNGTMNVDEIIAQAFVFFPAGFETSSITMTFALYELAKNAEIQDKVRTEIETVLSNQEITYDSLNEMKYLTQVIEETLRKYPPFPFVTRKCTQDYHMKESNVTIEKGRRVIIPILGLHYDSEYYPKPDRFDPERFSELNRHNIPSYAYIPFGEGPRTCIGMLFGLMQIKIGLVSLLRRYRFELNSKTEQPLVMIKNSFLILARGGIWLDYTRISY